MFDRQNSRLLLGDFDRISEQERGEDNAAVRMRYKSFTKNAVRWLPPKERQAVLLYYLEDLRIPAIARELGVAPSTVSRRLRSATAKLRALAQLCDASGLF